MQRDNAIAIAILRFTIKIHILFANKKWIAHNNIPVSQVEQILPSMLQIVFSRKTINLVQSLLISIISDCDRAY